ncbi:hypothetical protein F4824DRAFT_333267 [Ustulina deusta]|nr:hypothetical protein F4824DRAFT_333267 [Ustulina deusta]
MVGVQVPVLATLALVATVARSNSVNLLNDIPVDTIMDEGTTFVLKWEWDGDSTGIGELDMYLFTLDDSGTSQTNVLEDKLNLTMGRYPWVVEATTGHKTLDWYCSLGITYNGGFSSISGRSFRIRASTTPSSTSTRATSTSSSTSITGSPTTSTPVESSQPASSSAGLSGGVVAGIVVGVLAGVGIFAALVGLIIYYRRKSQREEKKTAPDPSSGAEKRDGNAVEAQYQKPELDAAEPERVYYELDGARQTLEVDASVHPTELDSNSRSELPGDTADGRRELRGTAG